MRKETRGRKPIPIIDSTPYSSIVFLIASETNYPEAISKARGTDSSSTVKQLETLKREQFLNEPTKEKLLNKTIYSINWERVIEEFIKYIKDSVDYVISEEKRIGLNLNLLYVGYEKRVELLKQKDFQDKLKQNKYLLKFFQSYYSKIGELKESWSIKATFDYLCFFGNLNFLKKLNCASYYYNLEKALEQFSHTNPVDYPNSKLPETKEEKKEFINKFSEQIENQRKNDKNRLKKLRIKNPEIVQLFNLGHILEIAKLKPALRMGLENGIIEVGKEIFYNVFSPEEIKDYVHKLENPILHFERDLEEIENIRKELSEKIGEEIPSSINEDKEQATSS
jgi:hypothetical protein